MRERKLRSDSETNRQIIASTRRVKKFYQYFAVIIATAFISSAVTLTISADPPASAPDTVLDWDGLRAYSVNGVRYATPDDTDSIQDAIDDLHTNHDGGLVVLQGGEYDMPNGSQIVMHSNIALVGVGWDTHLTWDDPYNFFAIQFYATMTKGLIKDIWVTGFGATHGIAASAFSASQCQNITIDHVRMNNWSDDSMVISRCQYVTVSNCEVFDTHEGLETSGSSYVTFTRNHVVNTVQECIEVRSYAGVAGVDYASQYITITENVLNQMSKTDNVIWLYGNVSRIVIANNQLLKGSVGIATTVVYGTGVQRTSNLQVVGNIISDCTNGFQSATQSDADLQFNSNQFVGCTIAIYFPQKITNASIVANLFKWCNGTSGYGVRSSQSTTTGVIINSNTFLDIGKYGIHVGAIRPMAQGNQFINPGECAIFAYSNTSFIGNTVNGGTVCGVYIPSPEKNVSVIGNSITNTPYGVRSFTSADYNRVIDNNLLGCTTPISLTGTHNVIESNIGYVSEAYGSVTVTGSVSYVYIYTGLSASATSAIVVGNNTGIGDYWITSLTTTITLYFTNQPGTSIWKFYWYAEV